MDEELLTQIIDDMPSLTTRQLYHEYNNLAAIPFKNYNQFISIIPEYPTLYDKIILTKDTRKKKIQIALQEAEAALIENASQGDIRSIEFLLKSQMDEYMDKRKLEISSTSKQVNIVQIVQDKLSQITNGVIINPDGVIDAQIEYHGDNNSNDSNNYSNDTNTIDITMEDSDVSDS